ncbi:glycosyltransferase family 25 protein [Aureimonas frigidaquae]|uniref:glycosyltransferase family 25 protein n=1 Tax=Aureimonas frigidaquae TaxID=424757 RepID=UPI0007827586|nr:glycosyltransferase family 25 protein [Aureimonas frigidaquae]
MRCLLINLDHAPERRARMQDRAAALGLSLERLPAVAAADISAEEMEGLGRSWERPLSAPELGCFLSHYRAWDMVARGEAPMLILEDDVILSPRVTAVLDRAAGLDGVDLLNLEDFGKRRFLRRGGRISLGDGIDAVPLVRDKAGSAAYILWPHGARKLLARAQRGGAPADAFLHAETGLASMICEPAMAIQEHVMAARNGQAGTVASSVQAARTRLPLRLATIPFHLRRARTQLRLAPKHIGRLGPYVYRKVAFDTTSLSESQR